MRFARWAAALALALAACSSPSSAELDAGAPKPPQANSQPAPASEVAIPSSAATSEPAKPSGEPVILSDLMKKVKEGIAPLVRGENTATADAQMEELFKKIQASNPSEEWKGEWDKIVTDAINGKPDPRGVRPWAAACKKCHDSFREKYKKEYHARPLPVGL